MKRWGALGVILNFLVCFFVLGNGAQKEDPSIPPVDGGSPFDKLPSETLLIIGEEVAKSPNPLRDLGCLRQVDTRFNEVFSDRNGTNPTLAKMITLHATLREKCRDGWESLLGNFVDVPEGEFMMGAPDSDDKRFRYEYYHRVKLSAFNIGSTEISQLAWTVIMGENPSFFKEKKHCPDDHMIIKIKEKNVKICPNLPVEKISYHDLCSFKDKVNERALKEAQEKKDKKIDALNKQYQKRIGEIKKDIKIKDSEKLKQIKIAEEDISKKRKTLKVTYKRYHIPTEAQLERMLKNPRNPEPSTYNKYPFLGNKIPEDCLWSCKSSVRQTQPFGTQPKEEIDCGFYKDKKGNTYYPGSVWNWSRTAWVADHRILGEENPDNEGNNASNRSVRGGSWNSHLRERRAAFRGRRRPGDAYWLHSGRLSRTDEVL